MSLLVLLACANLLFIMFLGCFVVSLFLCNVYEVEVDEWKHQMQEATRAKKEFVYQSTILESFLYALLAYADFIKGSARGTIRRKREALQAAAV